MFRSFRDVHPNQSGTSCAHKSKRKEAQAELLARAVACIEVLERRQLLSGAVFVPAPVVDYVSSARSKPIAVVAADVNGDGIIDLVTESANGDISIFLGKGDGTIKSTQVVYDDLGHTAVAGPQSLAVANVDGKPAIFVSSQNSNQVSVLSANSQGAFSLYSSAGISNHSNGSDINALAVTNISGTSFLVTANFDGSITTSKIKPGTTGFAGFTGTAVNQNSVITYSANGMAETAHLVSLAVGNFVSNAGGHDLIVVGSNGAAAVLPGTKTGIGTTATAISVITSGKAVYSSASGDLIFLNSDGSITPVQGLQSSTAATAFTNTTTIPAPLMSSSITTGDFNGDGNPDLIVSNDLSASSGGGSFKLYAGNGAGSYSLVGSYNRGSTQTKYGFVAADLSGDGLPDLAAVYYQNGATVVGVSQNTTPTKPSFTSANKVAVTVGSSFSFTATTSGFPEAKLSVTGNLPPGVTFKDNGNGTGTFTAGLVRSVKTATLIATIHATNASGTTTQTLTFGMVQAGKFTSPTVVTFTQNTVASLSVRSVDGFSGGTFTPLKATLGGTAIGNTAQTTVDGLKFKDNLDGTATLSGVPTTPGFFTLQITAGSSTQTVQIEILGPPVFSTSAYSYTFSVGTSSTTGAVALPVPGAPFPKISTHTGFTPNLANGLRFTDNRNGSFTISGDPVNGTAGTYTAMLYALNNQGAAASVPLTIIVNQPAVIRSASSATFTVGKSAQQFLVRATGNSGQGLPSFSSVVNAANGIVSGTLPSGLTFTPNSDGTATITGTPDVGTGGSYTLAIATATDIHGNALPSIVTQTFTLKVDEAPSFTGALTTDTVTVASSSSVSQMISLDGFGTPLAFSGAIKGLPTGMSLALNNTGTELVLTGTAPGSPGTADILFKLRNSDGSLTSEVLTLQLVTT